jgi:UDP-2,3-diacylglucosamine hydrolase
LLRTYSEQTPVYFMQGNRDFLLGPAALARCGMQGLTDPTVLAFHRQRYLLSHGDAWCLKDADYMQFRAVVRQPAWQADFLAHSLDERIAWARQMRQQSKAHQAASGQPAVLWADVDTGAACRALCDSRCSTLIHGHTHRPAQHDLEADKQRIVLSDWDLGTQPPRAQVLRIDAQGMQRRWPTPVGASAAP